MLMARKMLSRTVKRDGEPFESNKDSQDFHHLVLECLKYLRVVVEGGTMQSMVDCRSSSTVECVSRTEFLTFRYRKWFMSTVSIQSQILVIKSFDSIRQNWTKI